MKKIIVRCSICRAQLRIPADKHIVFNCPFCGHPAIALDGMVISAGGKSPETPAPGKGAGNKLITEIVL